jgi:hypothetical protein
MNILVIKQPNGFYINAGIDFKSSRYFFNGIEPKPTFDRSWFFVPNFPESVQRWVKQPNINFRYILRDESMLSDRVKKEFAREDVAEYDSSAYDWIWKPEYATLRSLYELTSDPQPDALEEVEFSADLIFEIDHEAQKVETFSYPAMRNSGKNSGFDEITNENLRRRLIDEIAVPSIYRGERPCKLTSVQTYNIIRQHVKLNIDSKVAVVTSDYDFCFTVKKRIKLAVPVKYTVDINNTNIFSKRKKKSIYEERYHTAKDVEIFEMTSEEHKYKGYTPIRGIEGINDADLKKKLDTYLADLMAYINEPVEECPNCKGLGVLLKEKS